MACAYCDHKGYINISMLKDNTTKQLVRPCPQCNDTKAYYRHIKEKYGQSTEKDKKIQGQEGEVISLADRRK